MARRPALLKAYGAAMAGFHLLAPGILKSRAAKGKEDAARMTERLGHASVARPDGPVIWLHGVSVGESLSALPVITALKTLRPDLNFLITTATTTSAEIISKRLPVGAIHQYAPIDTPQAVTAFLDHWRPNLAIFIESDIWPNILGELTRRGIKHALISARITQKTFDGWQRFRASVTHLLGGYDLIMAQDHASAERLETMGTAPQPLANLKTIGDALPDAPDAREALKSQIGQRPVILAASTHPTEEVLIARAALINNPLREKINPLLIMAPRHPIRADEIANDIKALGLNLTRRSAGEAITPATDVYLADTLGELGAWFRVCDLAIVAGSFSSGIGGHNPLEAARLGKAAITGPEIYNWQAIYEGLITCDGAWQVPDEAALGTLIQQILASPNAIEIKNKNATHFAKDQGETLHKVITALTPLLPEPGHGA
jgi:3-deoxy-D-manno-octulosonic-acid transferase